MRFDSELQAAGRRASLQAVPTPPPLAQLQQRADKQTSKRRIIGSGLAAFVLVAVSVPLALSMRGSTTVQNVVAGTGELAPAAQVDPPQPGEPAPQDDSSSSTEDTVRIHVSGDGLSLSARVLTGDDATAAAADAEVGATETLDVDGVTVWVSGSGEQRTVAALVEPEVFVEVTGDADQLDKLIDMLRNGGAMHGFGGIGGMHGFGDEFESFFDGEGFEGFEGFGPHGFDFEGFDFENFDFENFDSDGEFDGFGDMGDLEDLRRELEEHRGDIEQFLGEDGFGFPFAEFGERFDGCISISTKTDGDTFNFTYPNNCG